MKKVVLGISMMLSALGMTAVAQTSNQNNETVCCTQQTVGNNQQQVVCNEQQCVTQVCYGDSATGRQQGKAYRQGGKKGQRGNRAALQNDSTRLRKGDRQPAFAKAKAKKGGARLARLNKAGKRDKINSSLFNGIELNADQKSKLQALDQKMATERKAEAKKMKEEARSAYNKGVKDILSADQYAKFELNQKAMQAKKAEKQEARKLKSDARKLKADARKAQTTATGTTANQ
ncbi:MAG: hypothetical protein K2O78_05700 [Muribaculaceae bacterium]|nr:hypothetical protein [Muribaculaceae bacterium]MDE7081126.1 hypothetical protein [Muribaculaceae bacterium]